MEYGKLFTEGRNPRSTHIDKMTTLEQLRCINAEDHAAVQAVENALPAIAPVVDRIVSGMKAGGRLIYTGCGTSGRLGVLDASECPPTYGVSPDLVVGVIAGGDHALRNAIEGAEDSREAGIAAMEGLDLQPADVVWACRPPAAPLLFWARWNTPAPRAVPPRASPAIPTPPSPRPVICPSWCSPARRWSPAPPA